MRLDDYFKQQKASTVSETQKFSMYQKIIAEKSSKVYSRKRSLLHAKSFVYGLTLTVLFVALYGAFFMQNNNPFSTDTGLIIEHKPIKGVQADYIANIVNFNGDFYIEHDGDRIQTSNIQNGDTIILNGDTEMIFHMDDSSQAKVIGPAKFVLEKDSDRYSLKLAHGDFVEIQSLDDEKAQEIEVVADGILVHQDSSSKDVNFQIINQGDKHIVTNKGDSKISVTANEKKTEIQKAELVQIQEDDITLLTVEEFNNAIQDKEVSQTFTRDDNTNSSEQVQEDAQIEKDLQEHILSDEQLEDILASEDQEVDEEIVEDLGITQEEKQILSVEKNNQLYSLLQKDFLIKDLKSLFVYAAQEADKEYNIAYNNIEHRIKQLCEVFDVKCSSSRGNLSTLKANISTAQTQIQENYLIPPKYIENLEELKKGLDLVVGYEFENEMEEVNIEQLRNEVASKISFQ